MAQNEKVVLLLSDPIMKIKLQLLLVSVLLLNALNISASKITGNLDAYQIGNWAMKQHNSICAQIYPAIASGKTKALNMSKDGALELISTTYPVFISTNPDDPTEGYDSVIAYPQYGEFVQFIQGPKSFWVKPTLEKQAIELDVRFLTLLNAEQKLYLKLYQSKGDIRYENIPSKSAELLLNLNLKLHKDGIKPITILYKNDSFKSTYTLQEKKNRGGNEMLVFIQTDPNDPTIGIDSVYYTSYNETASDTSKYQAICFVMSQTGAAFKLEALSAGFENTSYYNSNYFIRNMLPYGYMKYPLITALNPTEKTFIEYCIASAIDSKLRLNDASYGYYLQVFGIKPKGALEKVRGLEFKIDSSDK